VELMNFSCVILMLNMCVCVCVCFGNNLNIKSNINYTQKYRFILTTNLCFGVENP
jgi:hypothetical protein